MANIYLDKYTVIETFKNNEKQEIHIGLSQGNEGKVAIINVIKEPKIVALLKDLTKDKVTNLLENIITYYEEENSITIITATKEGLNLDNYLAKHLPSLNKRMDLSLQYLKGIVKYKDFGNLLMYIYVDASQISIIEEEISFDEFLIIEEELKEIAFKDVSRKIGNVLKKIIFYQNYNMEDELIRDEFIHFIEGLVEGNNSYQTLEEILDDFRKHFIYFVCMENLLDGKSVNKFYFDDLQMFDKKKRGERFKNTKAFVCAFLVILSLIVTPLAYNRWFSNKPFQESPIETRGPVAFFTIEERDNKWHFINESYTDDPLHPIDEYMWEINKEDRLLQRFKKEDITLIFKEIGVYQISLRVKDTQGRWSEKYTEELMISFLKQEDINVPEEIPFKEYPYNLTYNKDSVNLDTYVYLRDGFSYKISPNNQPVSLVLHDLKGEGNAVFAFWMMAEKREKVKILLSGYKNQQLVYKEAFEYTPRRENAWEMLHFQISKKIDQLEILLSNFKGTLWLDDLEFEVYK